MAKKDKRPYEFRCVICNTPGDHRRMPERKDQLSEMKKFCNNCGSHQILKPHRIPKPN